MAQFWIKAFHIIFVISWFAGLFYLPRIFVNMAMVKNQDVYDHLLLMAQKLFKFMTPLAAIAIALGVFMWLRYGFFGYWLMTKITLVLVLVIYHAYCGKLLKNFRLGLNRHSHKWYRWFNEIPVVVMMAIVILVVLKPF